MRIFVFTTAFAPRVGGIERVVEILCRHFAAAGHEVRLATTTPAESADRAADRHRPFEVLRRPGPLRVAALARWCDVQLQANVSLAHAWPRLVAPARFVYQHHNVYQRDDGTLAPPDRLKRWLARRTAGIANSTYTAARLGCAHVVANPYDDATFRDRVPWDARSGELVFLGRLVSQKGADVLIRALGRLRRAGSTPRLTVVGDGPERAPLARLAAEEGVAAQVTFTGNLEGAALARELNRHRVLVAPSRYEEPFGVVALEALACGCLPVVAARGGFGDAIGPHGVTFPNGDDAALAGRLAALLADPAGARARLDGVAAHLARFRAEAVAARYLELFEARRRRRHGRGVAARPA
jgi:glycosyltransferase involved in cell wall biosynthesis